MTLQSIYYNIKKSKSKMTPQEIWLKRLHQIITASQTNLVITNEELAQQLETSERDLFRKVKKATGLSPQKYLRHFRMHQAMHFIETGKYKTVKEISHAVGYTNVSYFILLFEKEFGKKPLRVLKEHGWR